MTDTEIRLKFQSIENTLGGQDATLNRIEAMGEDTNAKVAYTNGKVANIIKGNERAVGAAWAFGLCFTLIVLPLLGYALYTEAQVPTVIQHSIHTYMQDNPPSKA